MTATMLGAGVLGCRETLAAPGSTVANGHPGYTNNLTQGVGFQVVVDLQFHAPVLVELLMEDDLHNGSAIASTQHTKITCAMCVVVDFEGTASQIIFQYESTRLITPE